MNHPSSTNLTMLILLPLLAWRVYVRLRRVVGRQQLSKVRPWITVTIFPIFIVLVGFGAHAHLEKLWWLAGGLGVGVGLGIFGLSKTRFEPTPQGLFYTPNAHLGIALSLLFVARLAYRLFEVSALDPSAPTAKDDLGSNALTLAVFGLLAGYYIAYAWGLLRWRFQVVRAERDSEAVTATAV